MTVGPYEVPGYHVGDCRALLAQLPDESIHCCVTSPPYWGLRDYGCAGQLGLEQTPDEYVAAMAAVFREVRRVLRKDGTCWVNLGDSYAAGGQNSGSRPEDLTDKQRSNGGCTVGRVAEDVGRNWLLFDLNPAYGAIAKRKTAQMGLLLRAVPTP